MASEWPAKSFAELISSNELRIGDGYRAKNDELGGNGLIFLRAGQVTDSHISFLGVDRFHHEDAARFGEKISRSGDVVITTKGNSTGRVSCVTPEMPPFVYSPHLSYWRASASGCLNQSFLRAWSRGPEFVTQLGALSRSTDMAPYLSLTDQRRLTITIPPFAVQSWIGDFNSVIEARIDLLRQTNTTLEAIAQALFKSWFVDFDPVHAKAEGREPEAMDAATAALFPARFEASELGLIPKGWRVRSLDSIATYLNGLALQKFPPESEEEFLPVIKIAQLRAGNTSGADHASARLKSDYVVHDGDVLFSWSGSLEVELWCGNDGALNQHLFKVSSREVPKWFYYLATRLHLPEFRQVAASKATTMGHIQRQHLTNAKVALPPSELMAAVSDFIGPLIERRISNALQARDLAQLRDTLLPRLISGKLRLPEAEAAIESALDA
jgi:type I restriction enzyme S subunit